jgi:hypothetical protein
MLSFSRPCLCYYLAILVILWACDIWCFPLDFLSERIRMASFNVEGVSRGTFVVETKQICLVRIDECSELFSVDRGKKILPARV